MGRITRYFGILLCFTVSSAPGFADDLITILELGMKNDTALRQAEALYQSNHEQLIQSRSTLLPQINAGGSTTRTTSGFPDSIYVPPFTPGINPGPDTLRISDHSFRPGQNSHGYGIQLSQSVFNLANWYNFKSAQHFDQAQKIQYAAEEQALIIRVAEAYFDVLRSIDQLETSRQEEEAAERQLEQITQREEVGLVAVTEVYESQAAYDLARNSTIMDQDILLNRYEALEVITGQPHPNIDSLREDFPIVGADGDASSWTEEALGNNLSLLIAKYTLDSQRDRLAATKAGHLPTISFSGAYSHNVSGGSSTDGTQIFAGKFNSTVLTMSISIPLYSGGAIRSRRRAAEYDVMASREQLTQLRRQTTQNIRNAFRRVNTDVLAINQRQRAITSATSALDAIQLGYEVGTRNIVEVLQARERQFRAVRDYSNARYNYVLDTLILKQIAGLLTPEDIITLNQWLETPAVSAQ